MKIFQSKADHLKELLREKYGIVYDHLDVQSNSPNYNIKTVEIDKDALDVDIVALQEVLKKIKQLKPIKA